MTDGIFYSGLTESNNRGKIVVCGAPTTPRLKTVARKELEEAVSWVCWDPEREDWLKPTDIMSISNHRFCENEVEISSRHPQPSRPNHVLHGRS